MKKRIYIAGARIGIKNAKKVFADVEEQLKAQGYETVNPFDNGLDDEASWDEHMKADIKMIVDCDAMFLIKGWWNSRGAKVEHQLAIDLGLEVIYE